MKKKLYDTKCYDLAEAFLEDAPHLNTEHRRDELAALIQSTIEDYFMMAEGEHERSQVTWNGLVV